MIPEVEDAISAMPTKRPSLVLLKKPEAGVVGRRHLMAALSAAPSAASLRRAADYDRLDTDVAGSRGRDGLGPGEVSVMLLWDRWQGGSG